MARASSVQRPASGSGSARGREGDERQELKAMQRHEVGDAQVTMRAAPAGDREARTTVAFADRVGEAPAHREADRRTHGQEPEADTHGQHEKRVEGVSSGAQQRPCGGGERRRDERQRRNDGGQHHHLPHGSVEGCARVEVRARAPRRLQRDGDALDEHRARQERCEHALPRRREIEARDDPRESPEEDRDRDAEAERLLGRVLPEDGRSLDGEEQAGAHERERRVHGRTEEKNAIGGCERR